METDTHSSSGLSFSVTERLFPTAFLHAFSFLPQAAHSNTAFNSDDSY